METRTKETIRYLGYGNHAVDDQTYVLIENSFRELDLIADWRVIYRLFDMIREDDDYIGIGSLCIKSKNLSKNLKNCTKVIVLGATLGIKVDQRIKRYQITDMTKAVIMQAAAAASLEEYLDRFQKKLRNQMKKEGMYLRPRFSPGYGDFDIRHQEMILRMLDAPKKIGLTMTDGYMLTPTKSVTALIGVSPERVDCINAGCETCELTACVYRRNS